MTQQLDRFFGLRVEVVREIDPQIYSAVTVLFTQWLNKNPPLKEKHPDLYIHKVIFDIEPKHFAISGIENRVSSLHLSIGVNERQQHKEGIKFINDNFGHRISPNVKHTFSPYKNTYLLEGTQLPNTSHFEEYLATVVFERVPERERKVKFIMTAHATAAYGFQTLKNVRLPVVTKLDFNLDRDVQLTLHL